MKSVRDRFKLLAKKHKVKMGKQERSMEILLEDLNEIEDDTNQRAEEEYREKNQRG